MKTYNTPEPVNVDAYQAGHFQLIPSGMRDFQVSQAVFRKPLSFCGRSDDQRLIFAGMRAYIENNLLKPITKDDVVHSKHFYSKFHASGQYPFYKPYPFPEQVFLDVVNKYGGIMPIVIMAQDEGQAHYVGEPCAQVFCDEPGMGELVGWIESSMLPYLWTSSIVATRGRMRKDAWIDVFSKVYPDKSRDKLAKIIAYKFHDFGRRGGASTQITGLAHLMNWLGTDTCDAAYVAQMFYNDGEPFGASSIMAAAHRTVTPWASENEAINFALEKFGSGILAFVADSYDYIRCMEKLASYAMVIRTRGGFLVGRPDSGDVVQTVLDGLRIFENGFGLDEAATTEAGGLKVIQNAGIIQGDGVSDEVLFQKLFPAVIAAGYSPINLTIGMGEHNHRALRSETEIGYKTCVVGIKDSDYPDYRILEPGYAQVMKGSENPWKRSIPCPVGLEFLGRTKDENRVYPISIEHMINGYAGDMGIVFDGRPVARKLIRGLQEWVDVRVNAWCSWEDLSAIPRCDTFHKDIRMMQDKYMAGVKE